MRIGAADEVFWANVLYCVQLYALSFAWLFEDPAVRAKLAVFSVGVCGSFLAEVLYVASHYDGGAWRPNVHNGSISFFVLFFAMPGLTGARQLLVRARGDGLHTSLTD